VGGEATLLAEIPSTNHTSPLARLCPPLQCKCSHSCPHFAMQCLEDMDVKKESEGGWRSGQVPGAVLDCVEIFWTSQPQTLLQVITPFYAALLTSQGAAAGLCCGHGCGTQCLRSLEEPEPSHRFLLSQSHSNYPGDLSKNVIELL